jgi:UDP-2-acetamido-3-amino-2,3-dideoxy-glucuronate N-acetyltransferase
MNENADIAKPRIAVIGSGYWGKHLVRNYHNLGVLALICDRNEIVLETFRKQYPGIQTCVAFSEVLSREDIDGLAIATPAESHFRLVREALLAKKHVFVEKPLTLEEKEGSELIDLAENQKMTLMVGHLLQYHPVFIKLKELVFSGQLGRISYIYSHRLNLGKIRREENILWSFAPHDISMILALAGEIPESVTATAGNYLHQKIADVTNTHMNFASGLQAHIFVSWLHPFKEQKLVVVGEKKMAVFDDTQPWEDKLLLYSHLIQWQNNMPVPTKAKPERVSVEEEEPLRLECQHFIRCIGNGQKPETDGREGLQVLKVLRAAQLSIDRNSEKIELSKPNASSLAEKEPKCFIHPTAAVDDNVEIGTGTRIWHFSHVISGSKIGTGCNIGQNVVIGPDVSIGKGCKIQNNVSIYKGVSLEDDVFCGPSMVFTNVYNPRAGIQKMDQLRLTIVKKGATIGANATVVCGTILGRYSFIGAGAVVTRNVADHALVVGNPAKQIGWVCECGERLSEDLHCLICGKTYSKSENGLIITGNVSVEALKHCKNSAATS